MNSFLYIELNSSQQKKLKLEKKQIIESINLLEDRIEFVDNEINKADKQIRNLTKLSERKNKRKIYKSTKTVPYNNLAVLNDSKNELVTRQKQRIKYH